MMNDYLTAEEIAALAGVPISTVYRLAHDDRWKRTRSKPRGYWSTDVRATLRRRALDNLTSAKDHA
jgi:hypothetical protein